MIKCVIHTADIHIRNVMRHEEYTEQLMKFIEKCKRIASKFSKANNYKKWEYLFIPAGKIQNNSSFKMLKENFIEK